MSNQANNNTTPGIDELQVKTDELKKTLALVRSTLESTTDGILVVSKDHHIVDANQKFVAMWKIPEKIMQSGDEKAALECVLSQVVDPDGLFKMVTKLYDNVEEKGELGEIEFKDGRVFERYSQPHRVGDEIVGRVWSFRDVTARKRSEESLRLRQRAIEASAHGVILMDMMQKDQPIIYVNSAFERITGYKADEVLGKNYNFLLSADCEQSELSSLKRAIAEHREERVVLRNYKKDGTLFWNELFVSPVPNPEGVVTHYVSLISDVTERKEMEEKLLHQATHDSLTGLPNRALLSDRISQAIVHAKRLNTHAAVIFIDLDHFKLVNDSAGHVVGDELLKVMAERLATYVREGDTLARMGGDEFLVVLEGIASQQEATNAAEKLLHAVSQPFMLKDHEFELTASVGVSFFPEDGQDVTSLIKAADISMYHAKEHGRNNIKLFNTAMTDKIEKRMNMESQLKHAIERKEFTLFYQPVVDVKTNRITGAEALIRWEHPTMGLVPPIDFISITEETGLIIPIGNWVLSEACEQLRAWQDMGFKHLEMAVNMSSKQLEHKGIIESIKKAFMGACIDPAFLEVELTESVLLVDAEKAIEKLDEIRGLGVRIAIDDFGTGYSSLNYLKRFPVDTLKIDQSFVRDLLTNENDKGIVKAIMNLAKTLNLAVLAEGVETEGHLKFLRELGCGQFQGYLFSKPIRAKDFTALLVKEKEKAGANIPL